MFQDAIRKLEDLIRKIEHKGAEAPVEMTQYELSYWASDVREAISSIQRAMK